MISLDSVSLSSHKRVSSLARELAVLFLYKCETQRIYFFSPTYFQTTMAQLLPEELNPVRRRKVRSLVRQLIREVFGHYYELVVQIDGQLHNWSIARLHAVDKVIIILATSELLYRRHKTPPAVVITQAIELAKVYGTSDSAGFINGILDGLAQAVRQVTSEENE